MPLLSKVSPVLTEKDLNRLWSKVVKGPGENDCWGVVIAKLAGEPLTKNEVLGTAGEGGSKVWPC